MAMKIRSALPNGCFAISERAPCWFVVSPPLPRASLIARTPMIA
jgi:hypothetical protein